MGGSVDLVAPAGLLGAEGTVIFFITAVEAG